MALVVSKVKQNLPDIIVTEQELFSEFEYWSKIAINNTLQTMMYCCLVGTDESIQLDIIEYFEGIVDSNGNVDFLTDENKTRLVTK